MPSAKGIVQVNVDSNVDRLRRKNGRFRKGIPDMEDDMARKFAEDLRDEIKKQIGIKFDDFRGTLADAPEIDKRGSSAGGVDYRVHVNAYNDGTNYAAWHEYSQTGHYAYYEEHGEENRELIAWAKMKGLYEDTWRLFVKPVNQEEGSFMEPAVQEAISKARDRLNSNDNAVSEEMEETFD
jgi:hypothetical protein